MPNESATAVRVDVPVLENLIARVFHRLGVPSDDSECAAKCLVSADVHGISSHGVARLPRYTRGFLEGLINPRPKTRCVVNGPTLALVDGDNGLGQTVAVEAMELAIAKASAAGIGAVSVRNSNHYGTAGYFALMAVPFGQIGVSLTNGHRRVVPPGGQLPMFGTNPIAVAVPTGPDQDPWLLDMATSVVSRGKVEEAQRRGETIPEGWAVDRAGCPTRDPDLLLREGSNLPLGGTLMLGGHKGYGLAVLVDILAGVLSGSNFGSSFRDQWEEGTPDNIGHFFLALDVGQLHPLSAFTARMSQMMNDLKNTPTTKGEDPIQVHGEPEFTAARFNLVHGVPLLESTVEMIREIAHSYQLRPDF